MDSTLERVERGSSLLAREKEIVSTVEEDNTSSSMCYSTQESKL